MPLVSRFNFSFQLAQEILSFSYQTIFVYLLINYIIFNFITLKHSSYSNVLFYKA